MAALFAAKAGRKTVLLEGKTRPGAKILISGGGRCNVLPSEVDLEDFSTDSSRKTLRNILGGWPLAEVGAFFEEELGVPLKLEPTGKLFPQSDRARDVLEALLSANRQAGVTLQCDFRLTSFTRDADRFRLKPRSGAELTASRVILATGGLSVPNTGSDGEGLSMLSRLGHEVVTTRPALVPLLARDGAWKQISGVAAPARISARRGDRTLAARSGDFLFTHRGFSGPVVLDMSEFVTHPDNADVVLTVEWLAEGGTSLDWGTLLKARGSATVSSLLRRHLPRRLAEFVAGQAGVPGEQRLAELPRESRLKLLTGLAAWPLPLSGDEGFKKAEVTAGGIPLAEIRPKTLESRLVPDLFLCGELLDVTGRIGGFNFLWAWVSGRRAGEGAARLAPAS
jgi:predicted Rossmann fold flavoprotein